MNYRYTVRSHQTAVVILDNYTGEKLYVSPILERSKLVVMCRKLNNQT